MQIHSRYGTIENCVGAFSDGQLKVDLGCGYYKPEGFLGIDDLRGSESQNVNEQNSPDILMDLNREKLPFRDSSCAEIRASHFLEHAEVDHIVNEAFRVLKPGGSFRIIVPYASSAEGMYPGHNIFFTEKWFEENLNFGKKFRIRALHFKPSDYWRRLPRLIRIFIPFKFARIFFFNACNEMTLEAEPIK